MSEDKTELKKVAIYTDGACSGNPGPGGYGAVLICGKHRKELSGGFRLTTSVRMEIMAAIAGLEALKTKCRVTVCSDSRILVNSMSKGWARKWRANAWGTRANADLWKRLLERCEQHEVEFIWVEGHAGHPENELADGLSTKAARQNNLAVDTAYEKGETEIKPLTLF